MGHDLYTYLIYGIYKHKFLPPSWWHMVNNGTLSYASMELRNYYSVDRVFGFEVRPSEVMEKSLFANKNLLRFKQLGDQYLKEEYRPYLFTGCGGDTMHDTPDDEYRESEMLEYLFSKDKLELTDIESRELESIKKYEQEAWVQLALEGKAEIARKMFTKFFTDNFLDKEDPQ